MKTKVKKSVTLTVVMVFLGLGAVIAQPGRGYGRGAGQGQGLGPGQGPCAVMYANLLDLSDEQQEQIADLRTGHLKKMTDLRNQMREKRARLQTLTTGDNYNEREANRVIEELGTIHTTMMKERTSHRQEVRSLLTEDQQVIFDSRNGRRMGQGMGRNRGGRGFGMGYGGGYGPCRYAN